MASLSCDKFEASQSRGSGRGPCLACQPCQITPLPNVGFSFVTTHRPVGLLAKPSLFKHGAHRWATRYKVHHTFIIDILGYSRTQTTKQLMISCTKTTDTIRASISRPVNRQKDNAINKRRPHSPIASARRLKHPGGNVLGFSASCSHWATCASIPGPYAPLPRPSCQVPHLVTSPLPCGLTGSSTPNWFRVNGILPGRWAFLCSTLDNKFRAGGRSNIQHNITLLFVQLWDGSLS